MVNMATYLQLLNASNISVPPIEIDASVLYGKEIHSKIRDWQQRYERYSTEMADLDIPSDFMELVAKYPVSMCKKEMNNTIKLLIALFYFYHPIGMEPFNVDMFEGEVPFNADKMVKEANEFFNKHVHEIIQPSYEQLSLIFDKSKATIFTAIQEKGEEAKTLIEQGQLRRNARKLAMKEIIAEEKEKLKLESQNNTQFQQTDERT